MNTFADIIYVLNLNLDSKMTFPVNQEYNDTLMRWAIGPDGKRVFINDVPNGLNCNCTCLKCKQPVIAKNKETNVRIAHFAHYGDYTHENKRSCDGKCDEIMLHDIAEHIIAQQKCVMLPDYLHYKAQRVEFADVEVEQRQDRSDMQPDIVGVTKEGDRILIEIKNTHPVDYKKLQKIYENKLMCLEIDISKEDQDSIRRFLLEKTNDRIWLNNPKYLENTIEELKKEYPHLEIHKTSFCYNCSQYNDCQSKKYSKYKAKKDGDSIVLCTYDGPKEKTLIEVGHKLNSNKKESLDKTIKRDPPKEKVVENSYFIDLSTNNVPIQYNLFGDYIKNEPNKHPFEPSMFTSNPLKEYFNNITGKKDEVLHFSPNDSYKIIKAYLHNANLNVETYGEKQLKQNDTKPFRVYVIEYNNRNHKFEYKHIDYPHEKEMDADKYAKEHSL